MIIIDSDKSYRLSELAKAVTLADSDLIYIVKNIDGEEVSIAVQRSVFLAGLIPEGKAIISGGAVWSGTGLVFDVSDIVYRFNGAIGTVSATQITLPDGGSDSRIDAIVVNADTNTIESVQGVESTTPATPVIGESQILIQYVLIAAGATEPTITEEFIYRDNADWVSSTAGTITGTVDFQSTVDPYEGTYATLVTDCDKRARIRFTRASAIDLNDYTVLSFWVRFPVALAGNKSLVLGFSDGNTFIGGFVNAMNLGLDRNAVGEWQQVVVPTSAFNTNADIDTLQLAMTGGPNGDGATWEFDYTALYTGFTPPSDQPEIRIDKNGTFVGSTSEINFQEGTNVTLDVTEDANGKITVTINASGGSGSVAWGAITGTLADQLDLQLALDALDDRIDDAEIDIQALEVDVADLQANKYDASNPDGFISESDVTSTSRSYTQGQGFTIEDLTITPGTPNVVNWNVDTSNMKRLVLNADAELQVPSGSLNVTGSIEVENDGGFTLTFAAGLNTAYILGDTPTTTDTEFFLITYEKRGSRIWLVVNNQNP